MLPKAGVRFRSPEPARKVSRKAVPHQPLVFTFFESAFQFLGLCAAVLVFPLVGGGCCCSGPPPHTITLFCTQKLGSHTFTHIFLRRCQQQEGRTTCPAQNACVLKRANLPLALSPKVPHALLLMRMRSTIRHCRPELLGMWVLIRLREGTRPKNISHTFMMITSWEKC
jgi:hypothetical protein